MKRKITVEEQIFVWNYTHKYDSSDHSNISRLFFSPQSCKEISVECFFKSHDDYHMGCPLNIGFLAIRNGEEMEINFNKPRFVSEFIKFVLINKVDFEKQKVYKFYDSWNIFLEMGFDFIKTPQVIYSDE